MEGTFPSVAVVEARAMPLSSPTSITILSSPTLLPGELKLIDANAATQCLAAGFDRGGCVIVIQILSLQA